MSVFDRFRLDGKQALITGGSRGLGRAMALALADAGSDLILVGRDAASLDTTAGAIRDLGRTATTIVADAGVPAECERFCGEVLDLHGPVDILINNVGGRRGSNGGPAGGSSILRRSTVLWRRGRSADGVMRRRRRR
jgi:NAD(P)-dependent dehydrogenase (short-subunit alcohol dehydrogenase family)